jgi:hypothetical protein
MTSITPFIGAVEVVESQVSRADIRVDVKIIHTVWIELVDLMMRVATWSTDDCFEVVPTGSFMYSAHYRSTQAAFHLKRM